MTNDRNIFITGGNGMLATAFRQLVPGAAFAGRDTLDIANSQHLSRLNEIRPKVVINCAAYTRVDQAETDRAAAEWINGSAVSELAKACRQIDATLVHFSTDYVFDGSLTRPLRPDDPVGPRSVYGLSKLLGEKGLQQNAPPRWLILRTAWLYGLGGPNFPNTMINVARAGKPLRVINDQIGSPTYTLDLAAATLHLLDTNASGIFHFANAGETNWHDFAVETLRQMNLSADIAPTTSAEWKQQRPASADRPSYSVLDTSAYQAATGQPVRSWQAALRKYLHHPAT